MKQNKIAFLTTIFPVSKIFLEPFFKSLQNQTYAGFDVIVINDSIDDWSEIKNQFRDLNIIEFNVSFSPAKNREFGIKKVIELGYEYIIFGDSDDYFSENRVECVAALFERNDLVINDINIVDNNDIKYNYFSNCISLVGFALNDFLHQNIAGLSNIAVKTSLLSKDFTFSDMLIAVDWYFVSTVLILNKNAKVHFTNETTTYYRQYSQNTIGINQSLNPSKIELGIKTKLIHYENMKNFCHEHKYHKEYVVYSELHKDISKVKQSILNKVFFDKYLFVIKDNIDHIFKGWWSEILTLDNFLDYENSDK